MTKLRWSKKQADLLVKSVVKWETEELFSPCPLCEEYVRYDRARWAACGDCPMAVYSGVGNCGGDDNPYWTIRNSSGPGKLLPSDRNKMIQFLLRVLDAGGWEMKEE